MQSRNLLIVAGAVLIGLIAVLFVNGVFSGVEKRQEQIAEANRMVRVVVASQDLAFGTPVSSQNVRLVNWPANSVPSGAFTSIEEATKARVALRPIISGEPILASKVSGANGRATLSANLPVGQLAFSVPISEITGAGGFIRPGDVVDVLVTRKIPGEGAQDTDKMTDVVLESVPVLGIDQVSDENKTDPAVGKTATLQVDTYGAQKLALAGQLGVLTLALRNVADTTTGSRGTVIGRDISASRYFIPDRRNSVVTARPAPAMAAYRPPMPGGAPQSRPMPTGPSMTVVRGTRSSEEGILHGF
ncbi:MAG: Flp pilus assembly protein CpaB [Sphingomonadales bacterium]|nr:Flp pilus assembly protein CpaB [Sphingomonadaceae bacterium]MBS3929646.1 Flp pilus assembly protein CpaB [Sphingomonadales bacterium]